MYYYNLLLLSCITIEFELLNDELYNDINYNHNK